VYGSLEMPHPDSGKVTAPTRVLIVLFGAIGDVVRALPLLQRLRAAWPQSKIAWAVEPAAAPLLEGHPALDRTIVFQRRQGLAALPQFLLAVRHWFPDLTLDLQRHFKSGLTSWFSRAPRRVGFPWANSREGNWIFSNEHVPAAEQFSLKVGQFLSFADHLGLPPAPVDFGLRPSGAELGRANALLEGAGERIAAVFLGSTWPSRQWFAPATAELCQGLRERGLVPVLVGATSEVPFAREVAAAGGPLVDLTGKTTLRDVIAILARATVAVGPDSGPMHIAAAVGTPVVSLWGATSPARSAPFGSEELIIVGEAPCVPCYRKRCPIGRLCMQSITPAMVLERVDAALGRRLRTDLSSPEP
jgi:heptosyltransferase-1